MMAQIIDRKQLKRQMKALLSDAQVSSLGMTLLYLALILLLNLADRLTGLTGAGLLGTFVSVLTGLLSMVRSAGFRPSCMAVQRAAYLLLGIESQDDVHYAAPVRNLLYDALQYARQVDETARIHRKNKDHKGHSRGEFLSGFYREDKLLPVITLVVFFSPKDWDGPRSLREMMATEDAMIRSMLPEYRVHLVSPAELSKADFEKFHTSLGDVLGFIKYSTDKEKLMEWFQGERQDVILGRNEVDVLNTCINANLKIQPNEEGVTMCQAILEWKADLREEVKNEVRDEVRDEMIPVLREELRETVTDEVTQQITEQVTQQVTENTLLTSLRNLMRNLQLTAEQAGAVLGISKADLVRLIPKI